MALKSKTAKVQKPLDKDSFRYEIQQNYQLYLFLLPVTIYVILFNILPIFGILIAFKEVDYSLGIMGSPCNGL